VNTKIYALALLGAVAMLAIAGCGGSDDNGGNASAGGGYGGGGATTKEEAMPGAESGVAVITLSNAQKVGPVLVNHDGFTVYDFHKDKGTTSSCYGACAQAWPPVLTEGSPTAGEGATAAKLGTTKRRDGTTQVTYAGHPLYLFVEDKKPGEANGNDIDAFGGEWYALKSSGEDAEG
jgi:predicted lipoprotein with Yx(FWY)xxD motif